MKPIHRLNLVGISNFRFWCQNTCLDAMNVYRIVFWLFWEKKCWKNHKFFSKIGFLAKKGWKMILLLCPLVRDLFYRKIQTFSHRKRRRIGWCNMMPRNGSNFKFFFHQKFSKKICFAILSLNLYSRIFWGTSGSLWGHIKSVQAIKGHK